MEPSRGHHLEGLPSARYAVSKTAGSRDLGGSTPSPSASGGMAELERQRVATAQAAHSRPQVRVLLPPSAPRSSAEQSGGLRTHVRPFDSGRGVHFTATSFNGRTAGCYPANAGSTPAVAASQRSCPDRLAVEDAGLSHRKRGFDSRSGYCVTARPRTRLETRPGCLPGEAGSTPVEGVSLSP